MQYNAALAEPILRTKWHLDPSRHSGTTDMQPFAHNRYGPKIRGALPPFWEGSWVLISHNIPWVEAVES